MEKVLIAGGYPTPEKLREAMENYYGEVIDFLDFRLIGGYVWPTFNMADCWIVVGVAVLMLQMFFEREPQSSSSDSPTPNGELGA